MARCSTRRAFWRPAIAAGAVAVIFTICLVLRIGGRTTTTWIDDLGELAAAALAGGMCLRRARSDSRGWRWLGASALLWAGGQAVWSWLELARDVRDPFPSLADAGFVAAIPCAVIGMILLAGGAKRPVRRSVLALDALAVAGSLLLVSWTTVLGGVYRASGGGPLEMTLSLGYPVFDVVVATIALAIMARGSSIRGATLVLIATGFLALAFSDSAFAYMAQLRPGVYLDWLDSGWVVGYLHVALAAVRPTPPPHPGGGAVTGRATAWHVVLPSVAVGLAVVVTRVRELEGARVDLFMIVCGLVVVVAVLARQALTVAENLRLTRRLEETISDLQDRELSLTHEALHDPLTGLANRVLFADRVTTALAHAGSDVTSTAVVFCDLDRFKAVNDSVGHAAGDKLLRMVAERLQSCVRAADTVARLGGDEFAIVIGDGSVAGAVAERMRQELAAPFIIGGRELFVHASFGVALADSTSDAESIVRNADLAMYQAKEVRRGGVVLFGGPAESPVGSPLEIESDLHRALERDELCLYYQPVISLDTGDIAGFEALIRWNHPRWGILAPGDFIGIAERSGLIVPIGAWVLEQACRQLQTWQLDSGRPLTMAVNVSPSQLRTEGFVDLVSKIVREVGLTPGDVCLELTESTLLEDSVATGDVLGRLQQVGVRLAIDDFGTGYATLVYLRRIPVNVIKIDQSFVADLATDQAVRAIVGAVVSLADALGLETVAEGVETAEQAAVVRSLGCHLAQGYHFGRPVDAAEWSPTRLAANAFA